MGYYTDKDTERTVNALPSGWVGALPTYPTIFFVVSRLTMLKLVWPHYVESEWVNVKWVEPISLKPTTKVFLVFLSGNT